MQQVGPVPGQFGVPARQVPDRVFENGDSVFVLGEKLEVRPDTEMTSVLAENVDRERVKGAEQRPVGVFSKASVDPVPHLRGGLVGERERKGRSVLILFEKPHDAQGQHHGLAGTGAGEHEEWAAVPVHGPPLVCVEIGDGDHRQPPLAKDTTLSRTERISEVTPALPRTSICNATSAAPFVLALFGRLAAYSIQ